MSGEPGPGGGSGQGLLELVAQRAKARRRAEARAELARLALREAVVAAWTAHGPDGDGAVSERRLAELAGTDRMSIRRWLGHVKPGQ